MELDIHKAKRFRVIKALIEGGIDTVIKEWVKIGTWLEEVKRLGLHEHDEKNPNQTWEQFCERVAGFSRRKADQLIQSTGTIQTLRKLFLEQGEPLPEITESAARELTFTVEREPEKAVEALKSASRNGRATAESLRRELGREKPKKRCPHCGEEL